MANIRTLVIATLLVSMVMLLLVGMYTEMYVDYKDIYDTGRDGLLNNTYDEYNASKDLVVGLTEKLYNDTSSTATVGQDSLFMGGFSAAKLYMQRVTVIFQSLLGKVSEALHLPVVIVQTFMAIIIAVITFTIISGVLRNEW